MTTGSRCTSSRDDSYAYTVIEGRAALELVAAEPDDATVDELVAYYRAVSGEHPDSTIFGDRWSPIVGWSCASVRSGPTACCPVGGRDDGPGAPLHRGRRGSRPWVPGVRTPESFVFGSARKQVQARPGRLRLDQAAVGSDDEPDAA